MINPDIPKITPDSQVRDDMEPSTRPLRPVKRDDTTRYKFDKILRKGSIEEDDDELDPLAQTDETLEERAATAPSVFDLSSKKSTKQGGRSSQQSLSSSPNQELPTVTPRQGKEQVTGQEELSGEAVGVFDQEPNQTPLIVTNKQKVPDYLIAEQESPFIVPKQKVEENVGVQQNIVAGETEQANQNQTLTSQRPLTPIEHAQERVALTKAPLQAPAIAPVFVDKETTSIVFISDEKGKKKLDSSLTLNAPPSVDAGQVIAAYGAPLPVQGEKPSKQVDQPSRPTHSGVLSLDTDATVPFSNKISRERPQKTFDYTSHENPDLAYFNPGLSAAPGQVANIHSQASPQVAVPRPIQEVISQIVAQLSVVEVKGKTDTVITLKHPPIFENAVVTVSTYDTAKGEINISFSNLSIEAKNLLDIRLVQETLYSTLAQKDYVVHMLTTTTLDEVPRYARENQDEGEGYPRQGKRSFKENT